MGFIISRTGLAPFIISLGFQSIYKSFTYFVTDGYEISAANNMKWLNQFPLGLSTLAYIFIVLSIVVSLLLRFTRFGRRIYAVGGNPEAAYLAGIDVKNFKMVVYMINGALLAICAAMSVARINSASPAMGTGLEIDAIAACVVGGTSLAGGKGNVMGVVIGVLLLGSIKNSMTIMGVNPYYSDLFKGIVIVCAVVLSNFREGGIFGFKFKRKMLKKIER
jgi:ribose transport system permease protein